MKKALVFIGVFPMLLAAVLFASIHFQTTGCTGMFTGLGLLVVLITLSFVLVVTSIYQLIRISHKSHTKKRILILFICLSLGGFSYIIVNMPADYFKSEVRNTLYRENYTLNKLKLREDSTYSAQIEHADFGCTYEGAYKYRGDTLILEESILHQTDSFFYNSYLNDGSYYVPLLNGKRVEEQETWLTDSFSLSEFLK